ncbi:MAG: hypothetical protein JWN61_1067, partial [Pseudonocardiales bacterium]|nr:hypothetical protein [Pseudonocardiales bacterium]
PPPPPRAPRTLGEAIRAFVRRHGWRAYALPVLVVVTVVALMQGGGSGAGDSSAASLPSADATRPAAAGTDAAPAPTAGQQETVKVDQSGANVLPAVQDPAALPPGVAYTEQGAGTFTILKGTTAVVGAGPLRRYSIEAEDGITGIDLAMMAASIDTTLSDPRSWTAGGQFSLQRVDSGPVDFRITLVSSLTVRTLCGYEEQIETSCWAPNQNNRVVLNDSRWARGAMAYANDLTTYRTYMVNHEVGHALGFGHEFSCRGDGKAPLMMQQTKSVIDVNGATCQPNPWPNP